MVCVRVIYLEKYAGLGIIRVMKFLCILFLKYFNMNVLC